MKTIFILLAIPLLLIVFSCESPIEKQTLEGYDLDSLIVTPTIIQIEPGETYQLTLKGKYIKITTTIIENSGVLGSISDTLVEVSDTRIVAMNPLEVQWSTGDNSICTVSINGVVEAHSTGSTTVWCTKQSLRSNNVNVYVSN